MFFRGLLSASSSAVTDPLLKINKSLLVSHFGISLIKLHILLLILQYIRNVSLPSYLFHATKRFTMLLITLSPWPFSFLSFYTTSAEDDLDDPEGTSPVFYDSVIFTLRSKASLGFLSQI